MAQLVIYNQGGVGDYLLRPLIEDTLEEDPSRLVLVPPLDVVRPRTLRWHHPDPRPAKIVGDPVVVADFPCRAGSLGVVVPHTVESSQRLHGRAEDDDLTMNCGVDHVHNEELPMCGGPRRLEAGLLPVGGSHIPVCVMSWYHCFAAIVRQDSTIVLVKLHKNGMKRPLMISHINVQEASSGVARSLILFIHEGQGCREALPHARIPCLPVYSHMPLRVSHYDVNEWSLVLLSPTSPRHKRASIGVLLQQDATAIRFCLNM
mmetsp:Transcript_17139/g.38948  ORF Transcript_17139/g.38948 Transcript_17139/m.38948 type:complete len:261 (-) Transcript_17139:79-861(-)